MEATETSRKWGDGLDGHTSPGMKVGSKFNHVSEIQRGSVSGSDGHRCRVCPQESLGERQQSVGAECCRAHRSNLWRPLEILGDLSRG